MRTYYLRVLRLAISHALDITQAAIFLLAIVLGAAALFLPAVKNNIDSFNVSGPFVGAVVLIFIIAIRLLLAPYWIHQEEIAEQSKARKLLSDISEDRPFAYVNLHCDAGGRDFHTTPTWFLTRINLIFENLSDRLLTYKVLNVTIEFSGRKFTCPLPVQPDTFVHGHQQMTFGFDVHGIETKQFPLAIFMQDIACIGTASSEFKSDCYKSEP